MGNLSHTHSHPHTPAPLLKPLSRLLKGTTSEAKNTSQEMGGLGKNRTPEATVKRPTCQDPSVSSTLPRNAIHKAAEKHSVRKHSSNLQLPPTRGPPPLDPQIQGHVLSSPAPRTFPPAGEAAVRQPLFQHALLTYHHLYGLLPTPLGYLSSPK